MAGDDRPPGPSDQAALEELERLRQAIEKSRQRRREANDAFDAFLRSFGTRRAAPDPHATPDPGAGASSKVRAQPRTSEPPALTLGPPPDTTSVSARPTETEAKEPARGAHPPDGDRAAEPVVPAALTAKPPRTGPVRGKLALVAAVVLAAAVAWYLFMPERRESPTEAVTASPSAAPPPAPAPASKAVEPPPSRAEITTVRRVWLRVAVDGERVIEREVEADARIPLDPKEQVVIRAGDAGAVRLSIDGKDQGPFGREGFPVTRRFPIPPASPR
jgi:hypothetical protein